MGSDGPSLANTSTEKEHVGCRMDLSADSLATVRWSLRNGASRPRGSISSGANVSRLRGVLHMVVDVA